MMLDDVVAFSAWMAMICTRSNPVPRARSAVQVIDETPEMIALLLGNSWLWALYGLTGGAFPIYRSYLWAVLLDIGIYMKMIPVFGWWYSKKFKILSCASVVLLLAAIYIHGGGYGLTERMRFLLKQVLGYAATLSSLVLTWSPLQAITKAVKDRSNASIPICAVSISIVNSIMWLVLSRMLGDWFLSLVYGGSLAFELIQVACYVTFPSRRHHEV